MIPRSYLQTFFSVIWFSFQMQCCLLRALVLRCLQFKKSADRQQLVLFPLQWENSHGKFNEIISLIRSII